MTAFGATRDGGWRLGIAVALAFGALGTVSAPREAGGFSIEVHGATLEAVADDGTVACYNFDAPIIGVSANPTRPVIAVVTRPNPSREEEAKSYFLFLRAKEYRRYNGASADAVRHNFENPTVCPRALDELICCSLDEDSAFLDYSEELKTSEYYDYLLGSFLAGPTRHFLNPRIWSPDGSLVVLLPTGLGPVEVVRTDDLEEFLTGRAPPLREFALRPPDDIHGWLLFEGWEGNNLFSLSNSTIGESWQIRANAQTGKVIERKCVEGDCLKVGVGRLEMYWVQTSIADGAILPQGSEEEVRFVTSAMRQFSVCERKHFGKGLTGMFGVSWIWAEGESPPLVEVSGEARSSKVVSREIIEEEGYVEPDGTVVPYRKSVRDVYEESPLPEPFVRCLSRAAERMRATEKVRVRGKIEAVFHIGP